jgi:predicted nucleic acid-binding protein
MPYVLQVAEGAFRLEPFDSEDLRHAMVIMDSHAGASFGLADASVVVLARRHRTNRLLTLDQRHFRALQPKPGESFVLLPLD